MTDALPFNLTVEALPTGRYRLIVTSSPAGRAATEIAAPFSFSDLAHLGDSLMGRAGLSEADRQIAAQNFGAALFQRFSSGLSVISIPRAAPFPVI